MIRPGPRPAAATPAPTQALHVVEIVGALPPDGEGASLLVERLVERLGAGDDFRFTVLCPADGPYAEQLRALGAETVVVPMPDDPAWHAIQVLVGLIRNRHADVLHAHLPNAHRLAGLAGSITRTPVLSTVQGVQLDMPDLEVHRLVASQLSVVSEAAYFHAVGLGIAAERISLEPFDAAAEASAQADSLDALGERLRALARPPAAPAASRAPFTPVTPVTPVAIRAELDELEPSRPSNVTRRG
jgi:hypothetical protein